jgi:dolichol kinase
MSVVDDVDIVPVEDRMGVSLGSTSVSLLFYNVSKNFCGPRSILYWDIMTLLLCVVGLSFAMSCLLGACRNFRRKNKNIVKNGKEAVVNNMVESRCDCPLADLVFSYMNHIMVPSMIFLTIILTVIGRTCPTNTFLAGTPHDNNLGLIGITGIFTIVQWILLQSYSPGRMNRNVFSFGEWMVVSCLISVMATHYIVLYMIPKSWCHDKGTIVSVPLSSAMVVSQAGILGCLIGSTLNLEGISHWMCRVCRTRTSQGVKSVKCLTRLVIVAWIVFYSIQIALWRSCDDYERQPQPWKTDDCQIDWCSDFFVKQQRQQQHMEKRFGFSSLLPIMPVTWLFWFLRQRSYQPQHPIHTDWSGLKNYTWIIYWIVVLSVLTPIAIVTANKLNSFGTSNAADDNVIKKKKKFTVIARKYFHLVAIVLFVPPTIYAQEMMSLAYAIAVCLLILLESIRLLTFQNDETSQSSNSHQRAMKNSSGKRCLIGTLNMKQFFETFLDEKDTCATKGSFAFTHMALVIGCALPLWLQQICSIVDSSVLNSSDDYMIPFVGIIVLGVGDAAGAVVGSMVGKYKWPHSRKTMEGSVVMLVSMVISSISLQKLFYTQDCIPWKSILNETMFLYLPLTVLEAVTLQIDNLCLPIVGYCLIKTTSRHERIVGC